MKKLLIISLFFLIFSLISSSAFALLVTDNTDETNFLYVVPYQFATADVGTSITTGDLSIMSSTITNNEYVLLRDGKLAGISVAGSAVNTAGGATFDVTINGLVTGVQAWIDLATVSAVGNSGSMGTQYSYMRQYRNETAAARGFRASGDKGTWFHNADNPYGRATPLTAGDRIGVKVTTSSGFAPTTIDYVVTVYVLE